jgi:hypothetical protein
MLALVGLYANAQVPATDVPPIPGIDRFPGEIGAVDLG